MSRRKERRPGVRQRNVLSSHEVRSQSTNFHEAHTPESAMSGGVSKLQTHASCDEHGKSDIVGSFRCVLCVRTQLQISLCDMKMSPGHSRPHLCHMQTNKHKKTSDHRNLCVHTRNEVISTGNIVFVGSSHDVCVCSLLTPPHIPVLVVWET
jgi:hypothetical protein